LPFCEKCGAQVATGSSFCASCGAPVSKIGPPQISTASEERSAFTKVMWYGVVGVVGLVGGWVLPFLIFGAVTMSSTNLNLPPNAPPSQVGAALGPLFRNLSLLLPSILVIGLIGDVLLTLGFRELSQVDDSKFSLPWKLMIALIVGTVVLASSLILLFNSIPNIIANAPTGSETPSQAFFSVISSLLFAALIAIIGGIVRLAGVIGGEILGLWRVGSRYNSTIIKVGAIFVIIPLLYLVAPILLLIGAYEARGRLSKPM
jgi:hypothetical protein